MLNISRSKTLLWLSGVVVLSLLAIALLRPSAGVAGQQPDDGPTDAYDFPIKPGTPEWAALQSHEEMLAVCQIPESILQGMSTEGLVETCLNYPLYGDMLAYNSLQYGFERVASRFNGLQELLKREDAGTKLLARYRKMNPEAIAESWTFLEKGKYDANFTFIETLLAQDAILSQLTPVERRDLLAVSQQILRSKQKYPNIYGLFGQERTALIMGRILEKENPSFRQKAQENTALRTFLQGTTFADEQVLNEILLQTQLFLAR